MAHPGKKLLFMGGEFGQWEEWKFAGYLQWTLLDQGPLGSPHAQLQRYVRDLNHLLLENPALYELDFSPEGFSWIHADDYSNSVIAFVRYRANRQEPLIFVCNLTPVPRYRYRMGVPLAGVYEEVLNSDASVYGGGNVGNLGHVETEAVAQHGHEQSLSLTLPPLATIVLKPAIPNAAHRVKGRAWRQSVLRARLRGSRRSEMTSVRDKAQVQAKTPPRQTAEVGAMPDTRDVNFYEADPYLRFLLRRRLSADELALAEPRLHALGARLGGEIEDLAAEADKHTPTLLVRDKRGERVDEVVASRAYREWSASSTANMVWRQCRCALVCWMRIGQARCWRTMPSSISRRRASRGCFAR